MSFPPRSQTTVAGKGVQQACSCRFVRADLNEPYNLSYPLLMAGEEERMVKVAVTTDGETETLWAFLEAPGRLKLDNAPFFAYRLSAGDLVEANEDAEHPGFYTFVRVIEKSGNRTIRVFSESPKITDPAFKPIASAIAALGCDYEGFQPYLLSITIPPTVELESVAALLESQDLTWEYADPTYDDLFPG